MSKASDKEWQALVDYFNAMENRDEAVPQWRRVVFGFRVVVDNACDPNADTLEFKPEICEAMAEHDQLKAELVARTIERDALHGTVMKLILDAEKWRSVARELNQELSQSVTPTSPMYFTHCNTRNAALARFNAMDKGTT